jgi:hypothetical protein
MKYYNESQYVIFRIINKNKENYLKINADNIITNDLKENITLTNIKLFNNNEPVNNDNEIIRSVRHLTQTNIQQKELMNLIKAILNIKGKINFILIS